MELSTEETLRKMITDRDNVLERKNKELERKDARIKELEDELKQHWLKNG